MLEALSRYFSLGWLTAMIAKTVDFIAIVNDRTLEETSLNTAYLSYIIFGSVCAITKTAYSNT